MSYLFKTVNLLKFPFDVDSKVLVPQINPGLEKTKRSLQLTQLLKNYKQLQKITFKTSSRCKSGSQRSRRVKPRSANVDKRKKDVVISENCVKEKVQKIEKKNKDVRYTINLTNTISQLTKAKEARKLHEANKIRSYFYRPNDCYACSSKQKDAKKRLENLQQKRFYSQYNASRKNFVRDILEDETATSPSHKVDIEVCRNSIVPLYLLVKSSSRSSLRRLSSTKFKYLVGSANAIVKLAEKRAHSDTELVKKSSIRDVLRYSNMTETTVWKPKISLSSLTPKFSQAYIGERYLASNSNKGKYGGNELYYKVKKNSSKELTETISESLKPLLKGEQIKYKEIKEAIKLLEDRLNCYFERVTRTDHKGQLEIPEPTAEPLQTPSRLENNEPLFCDNSIYHNDKVRTINSNKLRINQSYISKNSKGNLSNASGASRGGGSCNDKDKNAKADDRSKDCESKPKAKENPSCSKSLNEPKEETCSNSKSNLTKDMKECREKAFKKSPGNDTTKGKGKPPPTSKSDKSKLTVSEKCRELVFGPRKKPNNKDNTCKGKDYKELLTPYHKDASNKTCKKEKENTCKQDKDSCKSQKQDTCKKEDKCKQAKEKPDTCKKEDPCENKKPCKSEKFDPCKKEDSCKQTKESCKSGKPDPGKVEDACKQARDVCQSKTANPCICVCTCICEDPHKQAKTTCKPEKPDSCKKEDSCKQTKDSCKSEKADPCKSKDTCKQAKDSCKIEKPDPCKKEEPCKQAKDSCKPEDPCKSKDTCKQPKDSCQSEKSDPCKQEDKCKQAKDSCKKEDSCKQTKDSCGSDPCQKDDPCKSKDSCHSSEKEPTCESAKKPLSFKDANPQIDCKKVSADRRATICSKKPCSEVPKKPCPEAQKPNLAPAEIKCELKKKQTAKDCCKPVKHCEEDRIKRSIPKCEPKEPKRCEPVKEKGKNYCQQTPMPEDCPMKIVVPQEENPGCGTCSPFQKPCNTFSHEPKTPPNVCKPKPEKVAEAPRINENQHVLLEKPDLTQKPCASQKKVKTLKATVPLKFTQNVKEAKQAEKVCKKPSAEETRYCKGSKPVLSVSKPCQQKPKQQPEVPAKGACFETGSSTPKQMPKKLWKPIKIGGGPKVNAKTKKPCATPTKHKTRSYCKKSTHEFNTTPLMSSKLKTSEYCSFRELIDDQRLQYYQNPQSKPCYDTIPLIIPRPKRMKPSQMSIKELIEMTSTPKATRYCQNPKSKTCAPLQQEMAEDCDDYCDHKVEICGERGEMSRRHSDGEICRKCDEETLPRRRSDREVRVRRTNSQSCTMRQTTTSPCHPEDVAECVCREVLRNTPVSIEEAIENARRLCAEKILAAARCQKEPNHGLSPTTEANMKRICSDAPQKQEPNPCEAEICDCPKTPGRDPCLMKSCEQPEECLQAPETEPSSCTTCELVVVEPCEPMEREETEPCREINAKDFLSKREEAVSLMESDCEKSENFIPKCEEPKKCEDATGKQHRKQDWKPVDIEEPKPSKEPPPTSTPTYLESPKLTNELPKRKSNRKGLPGECKDFVSRVCKVIGNKKTKSTSAYGLQGLVGDSVGVPVELSSHNFVQENFIRSFNANEYLRNLQESINSLGEDKELLLMKLQQLKEILDMKPVGKQTHKKVTFKLLHHDYIFWRNNVATKNKKDRNKTVDAFLIRDMSTFNRNQRKSKPSVLCSKILKKSTFRDKYPWNSLKDKKEKTCRQSYITQKSYESKDKETKTKGVCGDKPKEEENKTTCGQKNKTDAAKPCDDKKQKDVCSKKPKKEDPCSKKSKDKDCSAPKIKEEKKISSTCDTIKKKEKDPCSSKSKTENLSSKQRTESNDCFRPQTEEEKKKYKACDDKEAKSNQETSCGKKTKEAVDGGANKKDLCSLKSQTEDQSAKEGKNSVDCFVPKTEEEKKKFKACDGEKKEETSCGKKSKEAIDGGASEMKKRDLCSLRSQLEDQSGEKGKKTVDCFVPKMEEEKKKFKACDEKDKKGSKEAVDCSERPKKENHTGSNLVCGEESKKSADCSKTEEKPCDAKKEEKVCSTKSKMDSKKEHKHVNLVCDEKIKKTDDRSASEINEKDGGKDVCYEKLKANIEECLRKCLNQEMKRSDKCVSNDKAEGRKNLVCNEHGDKMTAHETCFKKTRSKSESKDEASETDCKPQEIDSQKQTLCESEEVETKTCDSDEPTEGKKKPNVNPCMTPVKVVSFSDVYKTKKPKLEGSIHKQCKDCSSQLITSPDKIAAVERELVRLDPSKEELLFCKVMKTGKTERMICKTQEQWEQIDPKQENVRQMDRIVEGKLDKDTETLICKEVKLDECEKPDEETMKEKMKKRSTESKKVMMVSKMLVCNEKIGEDKKKMVECVVKNVKEIKSVDKWSGHTTKKKKKNPMDQATSDKPTKSC